MKHVQVLFKNKSVDADRLKPAAGIDPNLILIFGAQSYFDGPDLVKLHVLFPKAQLIGCSTAGEISDSGVTDDSLVVTACHIDGVETRAVNAQISSMASSFEGGRKLVESLPKTGLRSLFVLSQGVNVNGTELVEGIKSVVGDDVIISGGLAGDGGAFLRTSTILNGEVFNDRVVALAFYGETLKLSCGSYGGWKPFGPIRKVSKADANIMYELDGEPALTIYKKYLGDEAKNLPAAGLRYPFALLNDRGEDLGLIRTILGINEQDGSLIFAGDIPKNGLVRLMHADNESLSDGARTAALSTISKGAHKDAGIAVLISCVGRKIVMGSDIEDEIDAVKEVMGDATVITGFYSYGEISPLEGFQNCKLNNQTMTISVFSNSVK